MRPTGQRGTVRIFTQDADAKNPAARRARGVCGSVRVVDYSDGGRMTESTTWITPFSVSRSAFTTLAPPT